MGKVIARGSGRASRRPDGSSRRPRPPEAAAERYRALARTAARRRAQRRSLGIAAALTLAMFLAGGVAIVRGTSELGASFGALGNDLVSAIANSIPSAAPQELNVEVTTQSVAAPIADGLPDFTKDTTLLLQGHVPTFALAAGAKVEVQLNGKVVGQFPTDSAGRFAAQLTLADGANAVVTTLLRGTEVVASSSWTVVVDRVPPPLTLVRPKTGDTVDANNVVVEGRTEPRAIVLVNDRRVIANADGSFSDSFTASAGSLTITVVARDQAGNETKTMLTVTAKAPDRPVAGAAIAVSLDRTRVKPGESVVADAVVVVGGVAKADVTVTLQVGVITIGSAKTDSVGHARIGFAAPTTEGTISVVVLGAGASGSATLIVSKDPPTATPLPTR